MNPKYLGYLFIAATVIVFVIGVIYEELQVLLQLIVVSLLLSFELVNLVRARKQSADLSIVKVKSYDWLYSVLNSVALGFLFAKAPLNLMNQVAIGLLCIATLLRVWTVYRKSYRITDEGIFVLFEGSKVIDPKDITKLSVTDTEISIDTEKYQNDFQIRRSELKQPNWNELKESFSKLERTWANTSRPNAT